MDVSSIMSEGSGAESAGGWAVSLRDADGRRLGDTHGITSEVEMGGAAEVEMGCGGGGVGGGG
jgi:hypothetical protein